MTPQRLIDISVRRFPLLVLGLVIPAVVAFAVLSSRPPVYQVSATLLPAQLRVAGDPAYAAVSMSRLVGLATNYAYVARSPELLSTVGQQLGLAGSAEDLSRRVDAVVDGNTAALTITARAGDPSSAAALANAIADAVAVQSAPRSPVQSDESIVADLATVRALMLETQQEYQRLLALPPPRTADDILNLGNALALLRELQGEYDSLAASVNRTPAGLTVVNRADAQFAVEIAPRALYFTLLAAIAGLLIAAGIASVRESFDDTVRSPKDVERVAGLRTLAAISSMKRRRLRGRIRGLVTIVAPRSDISEAYRKLRTAIDFAAGDTSFRTLLVTSSAQGEGKTLTAANLAVVYAQAGHHVLLVDANLRTPGVHRVFDLPNTQGLTTLLRSDEVGLDALAQGVGQANLRVLTTGPLPPNPAELLGSQRMRVVLDRLETSDLVIVDSPALVAVSDSAILSSFLDATLLVVSAGRSRGGAVRLGRDALDEARATVLGAVLNRAGRASHAGRSDEATVPLTAAGAVERASPT